MKSIEAMENKRDEVIRLCVCPKCPSYLSCNENGGFCLSSIGKSKCIDKERGCLCRSCPVTKRFALARQYYCMKGSEYEQSISPKK